jgi:hypothetical protein
MSSTWSWSPPVDLELWIVLFYVAALLIGAKIVEAVARMLFARSQRYGERGFEYIAARDAYRCPDGNFLELHRVQDDKRFAVYRARASHCRFCRLKAQCAPSPEGRLVFRSLAVWAETSVGMLHRYISIVMFAAAIGVSVFALWRWNGEPGSAWLASGLFLGVVLIVQRVQTIRRTVRNESGMAPTGMTRSSRQKEHGPIF